MSAVGANQGGSYLTIYETQRSKVTKKYPLQIHGEERAKNVEKLLELGDFNYTTFKSKLIVKFSLELLTDKRFLVLSSQKDFTIHRGNRYTNVVFFRNLLYKLHLIV